MLQNIVNFIQEQCLYWKAYVFGIFPFIWLAWAWRTPKDRVNFIETNNRSIES